MTCIRPSGPQLENKPLSWVATRSVTSQLGSSNRSALGTTQAAMIGNGRDAMASIRWHIEWPSIGRSRISTRTLSR